MADYIDQIREALDDPDRFMREAHLLRRQGIDTTPAHEALDALAADLDAAKRERDELQGIIGGYVTTVDTLVAEKAEGWRRAERVEAALAEAQADRDEARKHREQLRQLLDERDAALAEAQRELSWEREVVVVDLSERLDADRKALRESYAAMQRWMAEDDSRFVMDALAILASALAAEPADTEPKPRLCGRCDGRGVVPDGHLMAPLIRCPDCSAVPAAEEE